MSELSAEGTRKIEPLLDAAQKSLDEADLDHVSLGELIHKVEDAKLALDEAMRLLHGEVSHAESGQAIPVSLLNPTAQREADKAAAEQAAPAAGEMQQPEPEQRVSRRQRQAEAEPVVAQAEVVQPAQPEPQPAPGT